jgi:hypothetical protein
VPWGTPTQITPSPYISPPDARDYLGSPFPSPPATIHEEPQAGSWATNLRSTLFAAISGNPLARNGTPAPPTMGDREMAQDKFTRPVLSLHRGESRTEFATFPRIASRRGRRVETDEEYAMPESDAEAIGSVFLAPPISRNSSAGSQIGVKAHQQQLQQRKRMSAGERYKRYARSNASSSLSEESSTESAAGDWSSVEAMPRASRMAGGMRAKGVKGETVSDLV